MAELQRPGVTVLEARRVPAPRARPSSVTGFVGLAHSGPVGQAQRVDAWDLYREIFGRSETEAGTLGPSVRGFFLNGGRACHVVRVENPEGAAGAPSPARFELRVSGGTAVLDLAAINPGTWGGVLHLRLSPSLDRIELTRTTAVMAAGLDVMDVASTLDLAPGHAVSVVSAADDRRVFRADVLAVGPGSLVRLAAPLPFSLPEGSAVIGPALDLEVRHRDRVELYRAVSLDPTHPRWVVTAVNGDDSVLSYAEKIAAGASILVRCTLPGGALVPLARPREGIDVGLTPSPLASLPSSPRILPEEIAPLLRFDEAAGELHLEGHLTSRKRAELVGRAPADAAWSTALDDLFARQPFVESASGDDGVAPTDVRLYTGFDGATHFPSSDPSSGGYSGVAALELADDVSLVALPDLDRATAGPAGVEPFLFGQQEMLRHCEKMGERLAVLDPPPPPPKTAGPGHWLREDYSERLGSHAAAVNGALYYPRLLVSSSPEDPMASRPPAVLPPSGYVAGLMARTDELEGVHRAPANEVMEGILALADDVGDGEHALYNAAHVNVLRSIRGRGIRVLGARLVARRSVSRTVPVRRTLLAVGRELRESLSWAVFEPGSSELRRRLHGALESYLDGLYRSGVLAGGTPEEAYYVRSAPGASSAHVVVELGLAPVEPAEFIVATVLRTADVLEVEVSG